mmetsp:Transcript_59223/g.158471  ORF Transcript_59223/g.158471 Transcript_59223/m.158471 type:complete len:359 (-) Transcript_59223:523-1599(-)
MKHTTGTVHIRRDHQAYVSARPQGECHSPQSGIGASASRSPSLVSYPTEICSIQLCLQALFRWCSVGLLCVAPLPHHLHLIARCCYGSVLTFATMAVLPLTRASIDGELNITSVASCRRLGEEPIPQGVSWAQSPGCHEYQGNRTSKTKIFDVSTLGATNKVLRGQQQRATRYSTIPNNKLALRPELPRFVFFASCEQGFAFIVTSDLCSNTSPQLWVKAHEKLHERHHPTAVLAKKMLNAVSVNGKNSLRKGLPVLPALQGFHFRPIISGIAQTTINPLNNISISITHKQGLARKHFTENAARGPHVNRAAIHTLAQQQLKGPVPKGAHTIGVRHQWVLCKPSSHPKIRNFEITTVR